MRLWDSSIHVELEILFPADSFLHWVIITVTSPAASRERLRSIVMSMSVCLSVREDISGTTRAIFTNFVHVVYVRGSVILRHVDDRPHRLSAGRGDGSAQRGRSLIYDFLVDDVGVN